jgi:hypothetical protein
MVMPISGLLIGRTTLYLLFASPLLACSSLLDASDTTFARSKAYEPALSAVDTFALRTEKGFTAFGIAVAMHGSAVAVAAPLEDLESDSGTLEDAGAVYLYDTQDVTSPRFRLTAPNAGAHDGALPKDVIPLAGRPASDWPAFWLALDDRSLAVGIPGEDGQAGDPFSDEETEAGAVYLYDRQDPGKTPRYLKAPNARARDLFGMGLVLSGPWLAVGAPGANNGSGTVFVYRRSEEDGSFGDPWVLSAPNPSPQDFFGMALAIHEDRLVVGAPAEDGGGSGALGTDVSKNDDSSTDSGAAYVYTFDGAGWSLERYLKPATNTLVTGPVSGFGFSVAISERRVLVGAPGASTCDGSDTRGTRRGAASIFEIGRWASRCLSPQSRGADVMFGWHVAAAGEYFLVGAPWDGSGLGNDPTDDSSPASGAVYLYRSGAEERPAYLKAPVRAPSAYGTSFEVSSGQLAVGAFLEPEPPVGGAPAAAPKLNGAVYGLSIDDPSKDTH